MSFIEQLNLMVDDLKSNPDIHVAHYKVLPPDVEAIAEVEKELGYTLDVSITDFYKSCGGIQLLWLYKDNEDFETKVKNIAEVTAQDALLDFGMFYGGLGLLSDDSSWDDLISDGVIMIPPIKTTFLDQSYNDNSDEYSIDADMFEPYELFEDFDSLKIRKFELFDVCTAISFILDGSAYPPMIAAYDNNEYGNSAVIYFKEYLNLLLHTKGARKRGHEFLLSSDFEYVKISNEDIENLEF